ncbi:MAG: FAD-binding oxidoreductase [Desulfovibrio sp.]|jgi:FAD/FMN-containing dehydrogenase|nr:FAD-binding oxidoreductase [Desulfovibrio sp.]
MTYQQECVQALGEIATFDPQILSSYDHDLGEMPRALMALVKHTPDIVVAAQNVNDVRQALVFAAKHGIPVTPRGQASSGYGGAIPSKGGMVLDLSNMNRVLAVDERKATVDVEPGVVWESLSKALAPYGLDNRVCPTSAPSSTVGGWFAMGGVGVGSQRYGSIRDNVLEIDVACLDGTSQTYAGQEMEFFHQTCGSLGVITRLRLACRKAEILTPYAVWMPSAARTVEFLAEAENLFMPYSTSMQSSGYCSMRAQADGNKPVVDSGFLVFLAIAGGSVCDGDVVQLAQVHCGRVLPRAEADAEWAERYYPMRIKKIGPSLLVGEFYIPLKNFPACWNEIAAALPKDELGLEAFGVRGGQLAVLVYILDNAGDTFYPLRMAKATIPLRIAFRHGGGGYATGMWFAGLAKKIFGAEKFFRVENRKRKLDPNDLMNPGKLKGPALPFLPMMNLSTLILFGTAMVAPLAARLPSVRPNAGQNAGSAAL